MRRLVPVLLLALLAACGERPPRVTEIQAAASLVQPGVVCRVGRNGGPLLADRGIGGTGAAFGDRLADRGIGGTGIVGVVTGFASVCVDGLEVRYNDRVPVDIDGVPSNPARLRVGQVVVIRAADPMAGTSLPSWARGISVRTEVAGPIEALDPASNVMTIAGQRVITGPFTWGLKRFGVGDWTAVSGLRQPDGAILASRLDEAPAGRVLIRGQVSRHDGTLWIGGLRLAGGPTGSLRPGDLVETQGSYQPGLAQVSAVAPDMLAANPTTYFGGTVNQLVIQAFVTVDGDAVWLNDRVKVSTVPALRQAKPVAADAIITLERQPDGAFLVTGLRYTKYPSSNEVARAGHGIMLPLPPVPPAGMASPEEEGDGAAEPQDGPAMAPAAGAPESVPAAGNADPAAVPLSCLACADNRPAAARPHRPQAYAETGVRNPATDPGIGVFTASTLAAPQNDARQPH